MKTTGLGLLASGMPLLAGCSGSSSDSIRFEETKPEVVPYFDALIKKFNSSQSEVSATHDFTTNLIASFVRGNPPDLDLDNYNLTTSIFVSRGVLSDLSDLPQAKLIDPNVQDLVTQYAQYKNDTSILPYSVAAEGVIYNVDLFDKHSVQIPTTWPELLDACDKFKSAGVTPIYSTFKDAWTVQQGLFDYVIGGMLDVAGFYEKLNGEGSDVGPDSEVSFEKDFMAPAQKMLELLPYMNKDAGSRGYADGNPAFASGAGAMYLQGPWAIGEVALANPKLKVGCFPLPSTDSASDTKCRVNLDLAFWIPTSTSKRDAAVKLIDFLMEPDTGATCIKYNQDNLAFPPLKNSPDVKDDRIAGLQPYVSAGKFYQGAGTYVPNVIPIGNYIQEFVLGGSASSFLSKLDSDWRRLAIRTSA